MKKILLLFSITLLLSGCTAKKEILINQPASTAQPESQKPEEIKAEEKELPATVPILMYHYVRTVDENKDPLGYDLSVEPQKFASEMDWLESHGYHTNRVSDILKRNLDDKSVILTFDDGYEDFYTTAFPILQKHGFTASVALITKKINQPSYLTDSEIEELNKAGIEIMSHSETHPDLTKLDKDSLHEEMGGSKKYLEEKYSININAFVYPSGQYNDAVMKEAADDGYSLALTTDQGRADPAKAFLKLRRLRMDNRDEMTVFVKKISSQ